MTTTALRRFTIGGSDAASACGVDPHRSRIMLWAEKTGRVETPETEAMRWGRILQPLIFDRLRELGHDVYPDAWPDENGTQLRDAERGWCIGHPDGWIGDRTYTAGIVEVKTANQWAHRANGDVPIQYAAQIQHYLHLTGLPRALLAVLVGGQRLEVREVPRDDDAIALLLDLEADFYDHLRRDTIPPPDGSDDAKAALLALFPNAESGSVVRLDREHWRLLRELRARKEQAAIIDGQVTELENRLKSYMGTAERAISPHDDDAIRWSNVQSKRIDTTALRETRPEVASEYETVTTTRRFTLL